jgi:hypothetical protein
MPKHTLDQLLRDVDAAAPAPPALTQLPARVRRRRHRRRMMKAVAVAAVAIIAIPLLALTMLTRPGPRPIVATSRPAPAPTRQDLARLNLQAELHEQTAAAMLKATDLASAPAVAIVPAVADENVLAHVRQQRDRAALVLIYEADQAAREKQTTRALAGYRRTIQLFPKTYAAAVARQRLKEMPT